MSILEYMFPLTSHYFETKQQTLLQSERHENNAKANYSTQMQIPNESSDLSITFTDFLQSMNTDDTKKSIIIGPDRADKTSLVFQVAVSAAASGSRVTYICTHPLKRLPFPVHGMAKPEAHIMSNVDFLYIDDSKELIIWLASTHTRTKWPSFLIIEDILSYATHFDDHNLERSLAKLCAIISDTSSWLSLNNEAKSCQVVLTAPTRMHSFCQVLNRFHFRTVGYLGPEKDHLNSKIYYENENVSIQVNFSQQKDCIVLSNVIFSKSV